jgi:hypothetical protein
MKDPVAGGQFDAKRLMERHLQSQFTPAPETSSNLVVAVNLALLLAGVLGRSGSLPGFARPSLWMMTFEIGLPLVALGAVFCFPGRFVVCASRGDRRFSVIGAWFFAGLAQFGAYLYAAPVQKLPFIEYGLMIGAFLFAGAVISHLLAKASLFPLAMVLPLSCSYGYGVVVQVNCLLDHSPAKVYRTVVSHKPSGRGYSQVLDFEPWGPNPAPKSLMTQYSVTVQRATFDAVRTGDTVCVVQRSGAMGMSWYTVQVCPSGGGPVVVEPVGGL